MRYYLIRLAFVLFVFLPVVGGSAVALKIYDKHLMDTSGAPVPDADADQITMRTFDVYPYHQNRAIVAYVHYGAFKKMLYFEKRAGNKTLNRFL